MSSTQPLVPQHQPQAPPPPFQPQYAIPVQQVPPYGGYHGMPAQPQPQAQPYAQPMMYAAAPMQYAQAQPQAHHVVAVGVPQLPDYGGNFSDGVFDCFNDGSSCLLSCCVAPIRWAMTVDRARLMTFVYAVCAYGVAYWGSYALSTAYNQIMCTDGVHVCHGAKWLPYLFWPMMVICWFIMITLGTVYRGKIRQQYNIHGDSLQDCCLHLWCTCCVIAQEARHVDRMNGYIPHVQYQRVV